jgi:tetratricopeptide (TPR) repeat protein
VSGRRSVEQMLELALLHSMFNEVGEAQLLAQPEPRFLFHLFDCEKCRDLAWAKLGASAELPSERGAEARPAASNREAEELLLELVGLPRQAKHDAIAEPRFHQPGLVDLLIEAGEDAGQQGDAERASELALLAVDLADRTQVERFWNRDRYCRACCATGNAGRVGGDLQRAASSFRVAGLYMAGSSERAAYCRGFGLLRWESGFREEAMALLRRAATLYGERRERQEEAACLALLGLVLVEDGALDKALGPLLRGCLRLRPEARPWLAVRCFLSAALCLAANARHPEARGMLERSWRLYPLVQDAAELVVVEWLEGKAASFLRDDQAEGLLGAARQKLLAAERRVEAAAATLDLAALYADTENESRIEALIEELRPSGPCEADSWNPTLFEVVEHFQEMDASAPPRMRAAMLTAELFQRSRHLQAGPPPLPWV